MSSWVLSLKGGTGLTGTYRIWMPAANRPADGVTLSGGSGTLRLSSLVDVAIRCVGLPFIFGRLAVGDRCSHRSPSAGAAQRCPSPGHLGRGQRLARMPHIEPPCSSLVALVVYTSWELHGCLWGEGKATPLMSVPARAEQGMKVPCAG